MRKQDYLVELIGTMSANEKRYFKLFSSLQPGEKRYLKLFDALEGQESYDAAKLGTQLKLQPKQLTDDKQYLTQALLQSLTNYDHESTGASNLRSGIQNIQSLLRRRRFHFAADLIEKTLKRAWELEAFEVIDELLTMRASCIFGIRKYDDTLNMEEEHVQCRQKLDEVFTLLQLNNLGKQYFATANRQKEYEELLKHKLLKGKAEALLSYRARSYYYEIWLNYYLSTFNGKQVTRIHTEERRMYQNNPAAKHINPVAYVVNAIRLSNTYTSAGENDKALKALESIEAELNSGALELNAIQRESLKLNVVSFKLWPLRHLKQYAKAVKICREIYKQVSLRSEPERFAVLFEYALSLFFNNELKEAIAVMDELLRIKSDVRSDIQPYLRILTVIMQLQLNNYTVVPHLVKSARWWYKKHKVANAEFDLLLKHALLIANTATPAAAWRHLKADVEAGKFANMCQLIQFDSWVAKKVAKA